MSSASTPPGGQADPTLAIAERQLGMLGELARTAMELSRAYAAAGLAAAHAVEVILADELWQPETGRARALAGAKDAADSYQKVLRSLRLTLTLEMTTAETVRDLRAGITPHAHASRQEAGGTPSDQGGRQVRRRPAGSNSDDEAPDAELRDTERLHEYERPDRMPRGTFREVVDALCDDIGVTPDWEGCSAGRPSLKYQPLQPRPPGWSECRPPSARLECDHPDAADRVVHPPP